MHEEAFYRWRIPDKRKVGRYATTVHRLTIEEAARLHPGAVPAGEPEMRLVPDGPDEFSYTGAFLHGQRPR